DGPADGEARDRHVRLPADRAAELLLERGPRRDEGELRVDRLPLRVQVLIDQLLELEEVQRAVAVLLLRHGETLVGELRDLGRELERLVRVLEVDERGTDLLLDEQLRAPLLLDRVPLRRLRHLDLVRRVESGEYRESQAQPAAPPAVQRIDLAESLETAPARAPVEAEAGVDRRPAGAACRRAARTRRRHRGLRFAQPRVHGARPREIGRASCRERVQTAGDSIAATW